ncbi:MAG: site-specific DNA-methyltransferase, partial [Thermoplasmata archaeon]
HPTQKPVALLERILLASTNEGDLVLDPFLGGGTTLVTAFRLARRAIGCELSLDYINLSIRRLCSNLVQVDLSVSSFEISLDCLHFSVDPPSVSVDRSDRTAVVATVIPTGASAPSADAQWRDLSALRMSPQLQLVQQELRFHFIGRHDRRVIFSVLADSLDDARQKFRASGHPDSDALFIIKTETEIYLA